jgi:hypothetical protein
MLMAASKAHPGLAAYAVAKAKKEGSHTASLSTAAIEKQIANVVSAARHQQHQQQLRCWRKTFRVVCCAPNLTSCAKCSST